MFAVAAPAVLIGCAIYFIAVEKPFMRGVPRANAAEPAPAQVETG
jgi:hypothetical protein